MLRRTLLSGTALMAMAKAAEAFPFRGKGGGATPIPLTLMAQGSDATAPFHTSWPGFKKGDFFPTSMHLVALDGSTPIQMQHDSWSLWSDGSARMARVCFPGGRTYTAGTLQSLTVTPTSGAQSASAFITPAAMAAAHDFRFNIWIPPNVSPASPDFIVSFADIVTNATKDTWGSNPVQGWDVPISGPYEVMVRAWSYLKAGANYHRWARLDMYVSARVTGDYEVIANILQPNWDIANPNALATLGPTTQTRTDATIELWTGTTTRHFAWGGPNDARAATVVPVTAFSGSTFAIPAGFTPGQSVAFTAGSGTLPTGITAGTNYYIVGVQQGPSSGSLTVGARNGGAAVSFSGGAGSILMTPRTTSFYGCGIDLAGVDGLPVRIGAARVQVTCQWGEAYMSQQAKLFPWYNQTATRYSGSAMTFGASTYHPNTPWGGGQNFNYYFVTNAVGDNPGDPRIGYIDWSSQLTLLLPHDPILSGNLPIQAAWWAEQEIWYTNPRTGRLMVGDNGPDNAGASYPQLGAPNPHLSFNGASSFYQQGWLFNSGQGSADYTSIQWGGYGDGYSSAPLDGSHSPVPWVVPAHLLGHPIYVENGIMQANSLQFYSYNRDSVGGAFGPVQNGATYYNSAIWGDGEVRQTAWTLRACSYAEAFCAAARPEAAYLKKLMDNTAVMAGADATYVKGYSASLGATGCIIPIMNYESGASGGIGPIISPQRQWMCDMLAIAVGMEAVRGERAGMTTYLKTLANYILGVMNSAGQGSTWFAGSGYQTYWADGLSGVITSGGTPWPSITSLIQNNGNSGGSFPSTYNGGMGCYGGVAPFPTTRFLDAIGNTFDTTYETDGGYYSGTTDYPVLKLSALSMLAWAGIVSDSGDDAVSCLNSLVTRFSTSPESYPVYSGTSGFMTSSPRTYMVWAIEKPP